jgi:ubiquitin carboxyl-terminal hydrolase 22/27/51
MVDSFLSLALFVASISDRSFSCYSFFLSAVSCGERAQLFCFRCGDFVYHEAFQQEKERIDYSQQLPYTAWKKHKVQRSFDPFQYIRTQDHGVVWRGLVATYPALVPKEHLRATQLTSRRQALFEGRVHQKWLMTKPTALTFAATQSLLGQSASQVLCLPASH